MEQNNAILKTQENPLPNIEHKDIIFRMLFREKNNLLNLYNAMNGTTYDNVDELVDDRSIYSSAIQKIPTPRFVVFYNGKEKHEEAFHLKLSDAFEVPTENPMLELTVTVLNINVGYNYELMT